VRRVTPTVLLAPLLTALLAAVTLSGAGCASAGIAIREGFGIAKREQLVDRVEDARDSQEAAKEQFNSALDEFMSVTNQAGKAGELEARYKKLNAAYDKSVSKAETVRTRIASVETVGGKLFDEWQAELNEYTDERLRTQSEQQLNDSRARYAQLVTVMKAAEGKMTPVLDALRNQVLFLKHNLNAQAIAGLQGTALEIQNDLSELIREMETSIAEANRFIDEMTPPS